VSRRALAFVVFAMLVSAGCVRLGFWQLHRLAERRALNAKLASRLSAAPETVRALMRDSASALYRRAVASGSYDWGRQLVLAARTHQGSPGVNIITPLRPTDGDTAVLVNRGWVYSADAMTVDLARWSEPSSASVTGYLLEVTRGGRGAAWATGKSGVARRLDYDSLAKRFPYPIAPFMLVAQDSAARTPGAVAPRDSTPARLPAPLMDEGPHLGYAIQWFCFALIGLLGAGFGVRAERRGTWRRPIIRTGRPNR
jgi:surfeit locus 1 family protein